jgi:hypothetical protein
VSVTTAVALDQLDRRRQFADILLPSTLSNSAYEAKYISLYWEIYLPSAYSPSISERSDLVSLGGWTTTVQELYPTCQILRQAFLALSLATISRRDGEKWMADQGLKLYAEAVQGMSSVLKRRGNTGSDALVMASKLFGLYEVCFRIIKYYAYFWA